MITTETLEFTEIFEENLPYKPYCSDTKDFLQVRPRKIASKKNYIQYNEPTKVRWLAYDCDYAGALEFIGDNHLPVPNLAAINKKDGRSHLFYGLEAPVCTTQNGRDKPKQLLRALNYALNDSLKADDGYSQFISKNPLRNELWDVFEINKNLYSLNELHEYFNLPSKTPYKAKIIGVGRNVTLFENARRWAYRQVLGYRVTGNRKGFFAAVLEHCESFNTENFPTPLAHVEVKATAKSISKWTWEKYTARWTDEEFSQVQSRRGKQSGKARIEKTLEDRVMANLYSMMGIKQNRICEILDASKFSVCRWLKD